MNETFAERLKRIQESEYLRDHYTLDFFIGLEVTIRAEDCLYYGILLYRDGNDFYFQNDSDIHVYTIPNVANSSWSVSSVDYIVALDRMEKRIEEIKKKQGQIELRQKQLLEKELAKEGDLKQTSLYKWKASRFRVVYKDSFYFLQLRTFLFFWFDIQSFLSKEDAEACMHSLIKKEMEVI